jgi:hypothetical protein
MYKGPLGFHIHNPDPYYNHTINVKAYYEGRFIFKVAHEVIGHFHIGFIGKHYLVVFAFGDVTAF